MAGSVPDHYQVPTGLYWHTRLVSATRGLWKRLGDLESWALREDIEQVKIDRPVYVTALARSGTTIVTEMLNEHPSLTSHRYADFPYTYTPYWRNWLAQRSQLAEPIPVERAHRDRIMVTHNSPEAVEEVLWMQFHPDIHDPQRNQALESDQPDSAFGAYYRDHIRKLMLVRGSERYLAKGNYNVSRIGRLLDLCPDARFVIPVRKPLNHIASLHKQHLFFARGQAINPRIRTQLGASGHFEFGLDRTAINFGDGDAVDEILQHWAEGRDARGWGLYWSMVYRYVLDLIDRDERFAKACLVVRYEDLCNQPGVSIDQILQHCGLDAEPFAGIREDYIQRLEPPAYYRPEFSRQALDDIAETTADVASRLGY